MKKIVMLIGLLIFNVFYSKDYTNEKNKEVRKFFITFLIIQLLKKELWAMDLYTILSKKMEYYVTYSFGNQSIFEKSHRCT